VLHGRAELSLVSDEYAALTMVLLRLFAFPPDGGVPAPARNDAGRAQAPAVQAAPLVAKPAAAQRHPAALPPTAAAPVHTPPASTTVGSPASRPASTPAVATAHRVAEEPPPWLDEPPDEGPPPELRAAPLRTPAAPTLSLPVAPATERPAAMAQALMPTALGDRWSALVRRLAQAGSISALVRELAWQGGLRDIDEAAVPAVWTLVVERESLRSPALRDKLVAALTAELGAAIDLRVEPGVPGDSVARRDLAERQRRQAEAEATIAADPLVAGLLAQFKGARIVPGSIKPI
jgi:DNA polymerase III subunit gamma/tau